ncbi:CBS domain-containing protein [Streptococcus sp. X16XC17]|uniref:CBS domain-containing protein n=1 Tax=unclassified Streptococcus TaxID=2608887 RepID=UPI00066FC044|nr:MULTISPECIES: CBS domain-containing protein [unclassified Streptococcus]TCD46634.1 CBS domain-containing protein [Streptococcus sp. X16XC17]
MAVKDFMTRKVIYISPDTTIAHAADLMREQDIHRLPVIENDVLVGLVTEGTIAEASPSKATSLSICEMNYLLNKTKVKDVMIRDVITVSQYASLEDAVYLMYKNKVGILPVLDNGQLYGVITDRDVFAAFLHVSGYGEEGVRIRTLVENKQGILAQVIEIVAQRGYNIISTVQVGDKNGLTVVEIQSEGQIDQDLLLADFAAKGIKVDSVLPTVAKKI